MSSFTSPLIVSINNVGKIELIESFSYYRSENKNEIICVPKKFKSDFATIPQPLQAFISPIGKHSKASVLHDYLCFCFFKGKNSRKYADDVFLEAMKVLGVSKFRATIMYCCVRGYAKIKGYK